MARVLVTDGQERSALAVVRSLGRAGHEVWVVAGRASSLAGASRYATRSEAVPDQATDPAAFVAAIEALLREGGIEVLLPISDAATDLLMDLGERVPGLRIPCPRREAYEALSDKHTLTRLAAELGVSLPAQRVFDDPASLARAIDEGLPWPVILKPARSSVRTEGGMAKTGVALAASAEQARVIAARVPAEAFPVLAQEQIRGPGLGVFLLVWEGRVKASFAHRRIREKPPTGGVSVYRESVAMDPELLDRSVRLLQEVGWNGVAMVEFKEESASGGVYLMEVNGRFWGSLQLAVDAGVDFPQLLVSTALGIETLPVTEYRVGVRSRWLWGDVDHLSSRLRLPADVRAAHPDLPGRLATLARVLIPWRPGDRFEVLRLSDPKPFVRETIEWFRAVMS